MNFVKEEELKALIENFHVLPMADNVTVYTASKRELYKMIHTGYVIVDEDGYLLIPDSETLKVFDNVMAKFNNTFHKSFGYVANASIEELVWEQMVHYMSTYGREMFGLEAAPYIPAEKLEIPAGLVPSKIVVVRYMTEEKAAEIATDFFKAVKAPSAQLKDAFTTLFNEFYMGTIDDLTSFELRVIAMDLNNKAYTTDPTTALRYAVYKLTNSTLLVNSYRMGQRVEWTWRCADPHLHDRIALLFREVGTVGMASIFFRYKQLFLGMKRGADYSDGTIKKTRQMINKYRRLADKYHVKANKYSVLNFAQLIKDEDYDGIRIVIGNADVFTTIKLLNYMRAKANCDFYRIFNIRTGTTYVKPWAHREITDAFMSAYDDLRYHLTMLLDFTGKTFIMPASITYAAPTSDKQMMGTIPWGTRITVPANKPITMGVAWNNVGDHRIDLDLHMQGDKGSHFGWNGSYRNGTKVLFTGDMTDARNGAAEAYYFMPGGDENYCLDVANFTHGFCNKVPFDFCIAGSKPEDINKNYTFKADEMLIPALHMEIEEQNMNIGIMKDNVFYVYGGSVSRSIGGGSASYHEFINGVVDKCDYMIDMDILIRLCGGEIIYANSDGSVDGEVPEGAISLMPEDLTVSTFRDILTQ